MHKDTPSQQEIEATHNRIKPYIHRTPILTCSAIDDIVGANIYFKCENFQKVGAFKARGGLNAVLSLESERLKYGVATHSSGNHAQAVALAAKMAKAKSYIVMPSNSLLVKKEAVKGYAGEVIECEPTLEARETVLQEVVDKTGAHFLHPYNNYAVIAGQATSAKELIEDTSKPLDFILTPVGGGGLLSGTCLSANYFSPKTRVVGCEPEGADDAYKSFKSGTLVPQTNPQTIADGLRTSLGEKPFDIIKKLCHDIMVVSDEEIVQAMRLIWERMKIIIEPSCAVPLAAAIRHKGLLKNTSTGIILSGGNVDLNKLPFK